MFLSQRPNNDKRPWDLGGARFAVKPITPGASFAPRPEFTQTRDPKPWLCVCGLRHEKRQHRTSTTEWSPRHEEFDTPVNIILAEFRRNGGKDILYRNLARWPSDAEKKHAARVLHLLAVISE